MSEPTSRPASPQELAERLAALEKLAWSSRVAASEVTGFPVDVTLYIYDEPPRNNLDLARAAQAAGWLRRTDEKSVWFRHPVERIFIFFRGGEL